MTFVLHKSPSISLTIYAVPADTGSRFIPLFLQISGKTEYANSSIPLQLLQRRLRLQQALQQRLLVLLFLVQPRLQLHQLLIV